MKKLKTLLQSNKLYLIMLLITFIYVFIYVYTYKPDRIYESNQTEFLLTIKEYKIDGDKLSIEFKENLIGNYYFKTKEEKENIKLSLNDKLSITGNLSIPNNNTIPNTFNYKKYLYYKNIEYTLSINKINEIYQNKNILYKLKNKIYQRIEKINNEYIYAFILGETNYINEEIYNSYMINGITHLFSISALHVSIFSSIIFLILKRMNINEIISFIIVMIFLIIFSFLSSYPPSLLRSIVFFALRYLNKLLKLNIKIINIFYITLILLLFINPNYIFNNGFILSFTITYFILLYSNKEKKSNVIKISIISFLSSLPIIINMNYEINIISFINNTFFIPYVSYIVFPLSLMTFIIPKLNLLLAPSIKIMETISNISSNIININLIFSKLNIIEIIIYYIILFTMITKYKKTIYLLLVFILFIQMKPLIKNENNIYFLDVNQGDSTLIKINNKNILIDTGGIIQYEKEDWQIRSKEYNQLISKTIPFLKSISIRKIDYLIITHGDYDHMGEAINLVENFKVEKVIFNCGEFNELEQQLIKVLDKKKIPYYSCIKELNIDDNKLYFLNNKDYGNENDNSSVIYTELNNHKFLFMGDAGVEVEEDLIEKYNLNNIDVLKVGHHGSKTSSSEKFINDINQKYSIVSAGKNNRYGHPNDSVLDNLEDSKIYRTDYDGSIMFKIKNDKLQIETCPP